jgi:hypothetical protein
VETIPRRHVLPLQIARVPAARERARVRPVGYLYEQRRAIRVRWTVEKNDRYRHVELPERPFAAVVATLPLREDRDLEARFFPDITTPDCGRRSARRPSGQRTPPGARPAPTPRVASQQAHRQLRRVARLLGYFERVAAERCVYALTYYRKVDRTIALARIGARGPAEKQRSAGRVRAFSMRSSDGYELLLTSIPIGEWAVSLPPPCELT